MQLQKKSTNHNREKNDNNESKIWHNWSSLWALISLLVSFLLIRTIPVYSSYFLWGACKRISKFIQKLKLFGVLILIAVFSCFFLICHRIPLSHGKSNWGEKKTCQAIVLMNIFHMVCKKSCSCWKSDCVQWVLWIFFFFTFLLWCVTLYELSSPKID